MAAVARQPESQLESEPDVMTRDSWLQLHGMETGFHGSDLFEILEDITWLQEPEGDWHVSSH